MRTKPPRLKRYLLKSVMIVLAIAMAQVSYFSYFHVRQANLLKQARHHLAQSEFKQASLFLQRALKHHQQNLAALRLMAELAQATHSPDAVHWRSRVVALNPHSLDDRLNLATAALEMRDFLSARTALDGVEETGKVNASYQSIAGLLSAASGELQTAAMRFQEALSLDPQNPMLEYNLAVTRLRGTDTASATNARQTLKRISGTSANRILRREALRELAADSIRQQLPSQAGEYSQLLMAEAAPSFEDQILNLEVLRLLGSENYASTLAQLQQEAMASPAKTYMLATSLLLKTPPEELLIWLRRCPLQFQTNQPVALLMAEMRLLLHDWPTLQSDLQNQQWQELEFLRHAFLARSLKSQNLDRSAQGEWQQALRNVGEHKAGLLLLLNLTSRWRWQSESEELLWSLVNRHPDEKWAFNSLHHALVAEGRTRSLMQLYKQQLRSSPDNPDLKNNLATTALLLDAQEYKPHELAREVYRQSPTNPAYASTYALSLFLQDRSQDALRILEQLPAEQLAQPAVTGYYGMILGAVGDRSKARKFLASANGKLLLPEERKLFAKARTGI